LPRRAFQLITLARVFVILPLGLFDLTNVELSLLYLLLFNENSELDHPAKQHFPRCYVKCTRLKRKNFQVFVCQSFVFCQ
jgi:hypothetical protein